LAALQRKLPKSSSLPQDESERGYELQRQMEARLDPCNVCIPTKRLDGINESAIDLRVDYMLQFNQVKDTVSELSNLQSILFTPKVSNYCCDGIIVPAALPRADVGVFDGDSTGTTIKSPVLVLEYSVTDPRVSARVNKVKSWFQPDGLIASLKKAHPNRTITILLCWPAHLEKGSAHTKYLELQKLADEASVQLRVVDSAGLSKLDVYV
jgi:hypothetical protein